MVGSEKNRFSSSVDDSSRVLLPYAHQQRRQSLLVSFVALLPHKFSEVCVKQMSGGAELATQLAFGSYPSILNVLGVYLRV